MKVSRDVPARRFEIAKHRHATANRFKVVDRKGHFGSVSNREQMKDGVGRAAYRHHHGDRIFKCFAGQNLARQDLPADGFGQDRGAAGRIPERLVILCGHGR